MVFSASVMSSRTVCSSTEASSSSMDPVAWASMIRPMDGLESVSVNVSVYSSVSSPRVVTIMSWVCCVGRNVRVPEVAV